MIQYLDLGWATASLNQSGDGFVYTNKESKTWCAPGTGCQEWSSSTHVGSSVFRTSGQLTIY
eukprot:m.19256 g.19256  ORF g.19256 m.19256 type:complete len:62 (-) comp12197_c0_seq1:1321-1506(-)